MLSSYFVIKLLASAFRSSFCLTLVLTSLIGNAIAEKLDSQIEKLICENIDCSKNFLEIRYDSKDKLERAENRHLSISEILLVKFDSAYSSFRAKVLYDDGTSDLISGRYDIFLEVPVPSRFIRSGSIIGASDITSVKIRTSQIRPSYLISANEVVGKIAKRGLNTGSMIRDIDVAPVPVIKSGDPVNVIYVSGEIRLKVSGTSMGNAGVGEMLKVRNEDTGAVLLGKVINKNTIQVGGNDD